MSLEEFRQLLASKSPPPPDLSPAVRSLWHDARGEWDLAHETVQTERGPEGTWVHAYLHRKEGDAGNAAYWYGRAGRKMPAGEVTAGQEWEAIAKTLLAR